MWALSGYTPDDWTWDDAIGTGQPPKWVGLRSADFLYADLDPDTVGMPASDRAELKEQPVAETRIDGPADAVPVLGRAAVVVLARDVVRRRTRARGVRL